MGGYIWLDIGSVRVGQPSTNMYRERGNDDSVMKVTHLILRSDIVDLVDFVILGLGFPDYMKCRLLGTVERLGCVGV